MLNVTMPIQVYIVDFGLAALAPDQERDAQDSTYKYTKFEGTPDYASTDHLRGLRCSAKVCSLSRHSTIMCFELKNSSSLHYNCLQAGAMMLAG